PKTLKRRKFGIFCLSGAGKIQCKYLAFGKHSITRREIMSIVFMKIPFLPQKKIADGSCQRKKTHTDKSPLCVLIKIKHADLIDGNVYLVVY
ncbi:MAG: hypothetical protein FWE80_04210, partial [Oscillospiraceae bacterium]|nr:hypothetical protein [Oscillospiraceae bacterium]